MAVDGHIEKFATENDSGVVDQDRDRSALRVYPIAYGGNLLDRSHIQKIAMCRKLGGTQFGNGCAHARGIAVGDDDGSAGLSELEGDGLAQPVPSAGDQRALLSK